MHTHSAAGGGACDAIRSNPTIENWPENLFISAEPMKPLLPVTTTTSGLVIEPPSRRLQS